MKIMLACLCHHFMLSKYIQVIESHSVRAKFALVVTYQCKSSRIECHWRVLMFFFVCFFSCTNGSHKTAPQTTKNKIKFSSASVRALHCCSFSLSVISQLLITEQVILQPECVPAAAWLSNIPAAEINRSSSLHITTYREEMRGRGRQRCGQEIKGGKKKNRRTDLCCSYFLAQEHIQVKKTFDRRSV